MTYSPIYTRVTYADEDASLVLPVWFQADWAGGVPR